MCDFSVKPEASVRELHASQTTPSRLNSSDSSHRRGASGRLNHGTLHILRYFRKLTED